MFAEVNLSLNQIRDKYNSFPKSEKFKNETIDDKIKIDSILLTKDNNKINKNLDQVKYGNSQTKFNDQKINEKEVSIYKREEIMQLDFKASNNKGNFQNLQTKKKSISQKKYSLNFSKRKTNNNFFNKPNILNYHNKSESENNYIFLTL